MIKLIKGWNYYDKHPLHEYASGYWQKKIWSDEDMDAYAEIVVYPPASGAGMVEHYELEIQIDEDLSLTGMTLNVKGFTYLELDFDRMDKHARLIIEALKR